MRNFSIPKKPDLFERFFDFQFSAVFLLLMVILVGKTIGIMPNYSEGEKSGYITSFSKKGVVKKTWEGSMNMGGMRKEVDSEGMSHLVPNTVEFTVTDDTLAKIIADKVEGGNFVTLHYDEWLIHPFYFGSPYIIKDVK